MKNIFDKKTCLESITYKRHGLSVKEQRRMRIKAGGCCAICNKHESKCKRQHAIDHCHKTGAIRGILCAKCNIGLGYFGDSLEGINRAVRYLENASG